jgi:hypothetical protein
MPQNVIRCSVCRKRPDEKLAQVTWAWINGEGLRTAYRQRMCVTCFAIRVLSYERDVEPDADLSCVGCGISVEDDPRITWCTAYIPGSGPVRYAFPACDPHAIELHRMAQEGASLLQEREAMLRGQAPQREHPSLAAWRALGIEPNDA